MTVDLVQTTTRDGVRLDGSRQRTGAALSAAVDAVCFIHGTGGNFYSSTLFDQLGASLLGLGVTVLRVNTRGHDLMSTALTPQGGRRFGAAYELVDDCRHDIAAWIDWIKKVESDREPRIALIGHSLGAVKVLYALANEPCPAVSAVVALSPPRLSYAAFCSSPQREEFLKTYEAAERLVQSQQPTALMEVKLPLPFVITAAGYVEKYGPDERYNFLNFLRSLKCPTLMTFGSLEIESNMAFHGVPGAVAELNRQNVSLQVIPGADHFYSATRQQITDCVETWLKSVR